MRQIIVEPELQEKLTGLKGQSLVCDANGHALGFFSPLPAGTKVEDLQLEPTITKAELEEMRKRPISGKPLSEILGRLGL